MGIYGTGLATVIGSVILFLIMLTHFIARKNTLRLVKVQNIFSKLREISITGFSTFFIDVAMGILTFLFNRQIMKFLGADALAVYGPIIQVSTFVQCFAYSVEQASQPIISTYFGAKKKKIVETLKLALVTTFIFGLFWTALSMICPNLYIKIFMTSTDRILEIAPTIIRNICLFISTITINIFSTYYFQAIMKPQIAFVVSILRGLVISGILIIVLHIACGANSLWLAMPIIEVLVMIYVIYAMRKCTHLLHVVEEK